MRIRGDRFNLRRKAGVVAAAVLAMAMLPTMAGAAGASGGGPSPNAPILKAERLLHEKPDECFKTIGGPTVPIGSDGSCPAGYTPKTNQAYMWSAARSGDFAYFGTGANPVCLVGSIVYPAEEPYKTDNHVCEIAEGSGAADYGSKQGDSRPSKIYRVNSNTGVVQDITPNDPRIRKVAGLRGGFAHNNVVILAGQIFDSNGNAQGMAMFAFRGDSGQYLGSTIAENVSALRVGVEASDGNLYVAARSRYNVSQNVLPKGLVMRWTGSLSEPFKFQTVGVLPNEAFYITEHDKQLAVSTSPFQFPAGGYYRLGDEGNGAGGIWLGPKLRKGGLDGGDTNSWRKVFDYSDFDPDPLVGQTIAMGALASFKGELVVSTYQLDSVAGSVMTLWNEYGKPNTGAKRIEQATKSLRPAQVFSLKNAGKSSQRINMLYGEYNWPVYDPTTEKWSDKPNKMGLRPTLGEAGFGNRYNEYSWTWTVFDGKLYMATFDTAGIVGSVAPLVKQMYDTSSAYERYLEKDFGPKLRNDYGGADLWRLDSLTKPAVAESLDGFGNKSQFGWRVFVPFPEKGFFLGGSAGADNLVSPKGPDAPGAEIVKFTPQKRPVGPPVPVPPSNLHGPGAAIVAPG